MPQSFENLALLNASDLHQYAVSIAATEHALCTDDLDKAARRFLVAHQLRRVEEATAQDGTAAAPALERLRQVAEVQDDEPGQFLAHYALKAEFDRMAAAAATA
jgi:hypothetical protein